MKHFLPLLLLLLTLLPANATTKKFDANPINIAAVLVEKSDSANVASTLAFYGYTFQTKENGYTLMKHPNGNEIRYTFTENGSPSKYPTIIVKAQGTSKSIDTRLIELDFKKTGKAYERKKNIYSRYKTNCSHGPHSTLIFRRIPIQQ